MTFKTKFAATFYWLSSKLETVFCVLHSSLYLQEGLFLEAFHFIQDHQTVNEHIHFPQVYLYGSIPEDRRQITTVNCAKRFQTLTKATQGSSCQKI